MWRSILRGRGDMAFPARFLQTPHLESGGMRPWGPDERDQVGSLGIDLYSVGRRKAQGDPEFKYRFLYLVLINLFSNLWDTFSPVFRPRLLCKKMGGIFKTSASDNFSLTVRRFPHPETRSCLRGPFPSRRESTPPGASDSACPCLDSVVPRPQMCSSSSLLHPFRLSLHHQARSQESSYNCVSLFLHLFGVKSSPFCYFSQICPFPPTPLYLS